MKKYKWTLFLTLFSLITTVGSFALIKRQIDREISLAEDKQKKSLETFYETLSEEMLYFRNLQKSLEIEITPDALEEGLHAALWKIPHVKKFSWIDVARQELFSITKQKSYGHYKMKKSILVDIKPKIDWTYLKEDSGFISGKLSTPIYTKSGRLFASLIGEYRLEKSSALYKHLKKQNPKIDLQIAFLLEKAASYGKARVQLTKSHILFPKMTCPLPYAADKAIIASQKQLSLLPFLLTNYAPLLSLLISLSLFLGCSLKLFLIRLGRGHG